MFKRNIASNLSTALSDTPVVLLNGARQTGKSTLVQSLASQGHPARYITFDDAGMLSAAKEDPSGFLAGLSGPVILDEIQRVPELFLAIKAQVDRNRQPGRFLLTGSANVLLLPGLAETLAGRMEIITLWPLSQGEIEGQKESFVDRVFAKDLNNTTGKILSHSDLVDRMLRGGYPEVVQRPLAARRDAWFGSYITTLLQRDVRDLANIEGLTVMPRLLSLLASRSASLLNFSELSRSTTLPQSTLKRYIALLETTFLVQFLPAWSSNFGKRLVKSPKVFLTDTGLMRHLMGLTPQRLEQEPQWIGPLLENFVAMELRKQTTWSQTQPKMFHLRTQTGQEVDIILEDARGSLVGIEVKASGTVTAKDAQPLRLLADALGEKFIRGIILYGGSEVVPFGPYLHALPISSLFES
jgi:predicted AAA+ superfamily ATPase